jgi:hypothetical protein
MMFQPPENYVLEMHARPIAAGSPKESLHHFGEGRTACTFAEGRTSWKLALEIFDSAARRDSHREMSETLSSAWTKIAAEKQPDSDP